MDKKLKRGIIAVLIANLINVVFSLATNFLLPKYLSVESYAGIKEFQLYVSYVGLLHFGYVDGIYLKYGGREIKQKINSVFSTEMSTMGVFLLLATLCTVIVALILNNRLLMLFALSILPQNMSSYFKFLYQAIGEFDLYGRIMNLTTITTFGLNMVLLFIIRTDYFMAYVVGYVILYFFIWSVLEVNFRRKHTLEKGRVFSLPILKEHIKAGFFLTLGNLSSIFLTSMDRWFVKALMNTVAFAQYSFAVSVENFLNLAITPVTTTLYNYFCREKNVKEYRKIYSYILVFATIIPAAAFPVKFILEIYLTKYMDSTRAVFLLFASQMFYVIIKSVYVNLYKVQRQQNMYFAKLVITLIIGFLLNVICFQIVPVKEAFAVGTLLSAIIWTFMTEADFKGIRGGLKEKIYLFMELVVFLFLGFTMSAIPGFFMYVVFTIIMLLIFMRSTLIEILTTGKNTIQKLRINTK